jgi:hypothetical protein
MNKCKQLPKMSGKNVGNTLEKYLTKKCWQHFQKILATFPKNVE